MNSRQKFSLILFLLAVFYVAHAVNPQAGFCSRCALGNTVCPLPDVR
jgi:hypothetical protein